MKKIFKKATIALMVVLFSATMAMAADKQRDRKKDGSCDNDCPYYQYYCQ